MRTLNRYLTGSFLLTFVLSLLIVTFVMCIGILFRVTDLIARGVSWQPVLKVLLYSFPQSLTYAIPVSVLTSGLLVFGRLSADGEITAMRASGVNMWAIVKPPCILAAVLSLFCVVLNNELVPRGHYASRVELTQLGAQTPLELLEEGRFIQDFPGMTLYIGKRRGDQLFNVRIYDLRKPGLRREVRAASGKVRAEPGGDITIDLTDVRIDPFADDRPGAAYCETWTQTIPREGRKRVYRPDKDDKTLWALIQVIRHPEHDFPQLSGEDIERYRMMLTVELHKRLSLGASCFAFAMLGIPLGIKAHRKESAVGLAMSLLVLFNYYAFILVAEALEKRPEMHPNLITWLPILISVVVGAWLIDRHN
ncbi:MAG: LptF/LptG family permease [Lentisphaerae bacterium]|nr:LptF/LptG family permease [Lentisphaerota bacterium]